MFCVDQRLHDIDQEVGSPLFDRRWDLFKVLGLVNIYAVSSSELWKNEVVVLKASIQLLSFILAMELTAYLFSLFAKENPF